MSRGRNDPRNNWLLPCARRFYPTVFLAQPLWADHQERTDWHAKLCRCSVVLFPGVKELILSIRRGRVLCKRIRGKWTLLSTARVHKSIRAISIAFDSFYNVQRKEAVLHHVVAHAELNKS